MVEQVSFLSIAAHTPPKLSNLISICALAKVSGSHMIFRLQRKVIILSKINSISKKCPIMYSIVQFYFFQCGKPPDAHKIYPYSRRFFPSSAQNFCSKIVMHHLIHDSLPKGGGWLLQ